ncbi:MAG: tetratricopeptide repeat protein [Thermodesulfobacteriota bacterium]
MKTLYNKLLQVLLCVLLVCSSACSNQQEKKEAHYQKGLEYAEADDSKAAILEFRNAVKIDPKFADARYRMALAYLKTGETKQAFKQFERAGSLDPQNTDALIKSAEMLFLSKGFKKSRERVDKILAADPDFAQAYALLASIELGEQNLEEAEKVINRAIELDSQQSRYYLIQSSILSARQDLDGAVKANRKGIELESTNITYYNALVGLYIKWRKLAEAETVLNETLTTFPDRPEPHIELAKFYMNTGRVENAEKSIRDAIEQKKDDPNLHVILGKLYQKLNKFGLAEDAYNQAYLVSGQSEDIKAILASFHFETGRTSLAQEEIDVIFQTKPNQPLANLVTAKLLILADDNSAAQLIADKLIEDFPKWGEAYHVKAMIHLNKGETILSYKAIGQALQYAPSNSNIRALSAYHHFLQRDFPAAEQEAAMALRFQPSNFRAAVILGKSLLSQGQANKSLQIFSDMEKQVPDNVEILFNKALGLIATKEFGKAQNELERTLAVNPNYTPALLTLVATQAKLEGPNQAVLRVRKQLEKSPANADYLILLANMLKKDKKSQEEALMLFRRSQELRPEAPHSYLMEAELLVKMGQTENAINEYRTLLEKNPGSTEGHMALGVLLDASGDSKAAIESYKKALETNPRFAPAANNLAWDLAQEEDADLGEALRLALVAKEQLPEDPFVTDTLGMIHYKRGSYRLALSQFSFAVEKDRNNPTLRYHLAMALYRSGEHGKAKQELEKCLQTDHDFPDREEAKTLLAKLG